MALVLSHSGVETWQLCHRKRYWEYEFAGTGLRPKGYVLALADGKAIHAGLESLYRGRTDDSVSEEVKRAYIEEFGPLDQYLPDRQAFMNERIEWGGKLLSAYRQRQLPLDDFLVRGIEEDFKVVLGEICYNCGEPYPSESTDTCPKCQATLVLWRGRVDLRVLREGLVKIIDHKSVKSVSAATLERYHHSMQMVGYCYGMGKSIGESIRGYGVNFIKKLKTVDIPTVRCAACNAQGCGECYFSGRVEKEPPQLFLRKWVTIGPEDQDRFVLNRLSLAKDIMAEREKFDSGPVEAYPMNEGACWKFGADNGCPFIPLCWSGDPVKWYDPSDARLEGFKQKEVEA